MTAAAILICLGWVSQAVALAHVHSIAVVLAILVVPAGILVANKLLPRRENPPGEWDGYMVSPAEQPTLPSSR